MNTLKSNNRGMAVSIAGVSVLAIAAILLLSAPFFSFAAGTTVSVSATAAYKGQVSISGTVSPAPSAGSAVAISVSNPQGVQVTANTVVLNSTGGFSYSFAAGSNWINGTYTVIATWAASSVSTPVTGITTFSYGTGGVTTTTGSQTGVTTTVFFNATTTIVSQVTTTVVQQVQTTVTAQPITSVTTIQQNSTTTVQQTSSLDTALAAVAIIIAIVAIVLVFMRKK